MVVFIYDLLQLGIAPVVTQSAVMQVAEGILTILGMVGVIADPTTAGLTDSGQSADLYFSQTGLTLIHRPRGDGRPPPFSLFKEGQTCQIDRINTPLTNEHFAAFCQSMVGQPYWYGTCVYKCTESLRSRKAAQYPSHYGPAAPAATGTTSRRRRSARTASASSKRYCWTGGGKGCDRGIGTDKTFPASMAAIAARTSPQQHVHLRKEQGMLLGYHGQPAGGARHRAALGWP